MLVVFAMEGRPPIDVFGRTIALDVGAADVVVVLPEVAVVVHTVEVGFATKSWEVEITDVVIVGPPTLMPKEPTADDDDKTGMADDDVGARFKWVGRTCPVGLFGGDSDLAPHSTHSIR